jgi:hypothetical protein
MNAVMTFYVFRRRRGAPRGKLREFHVCLIFLVIVVLGPRFPDALDRSDATPAQNNSRTQDDDSHEDD